MPKRYRVLKGSTVLLVAVATGCATPTPGATGLGADVAPKGGASLISNNASGLISNNAGGLISNNAGGLISNNAGGLISNNAGGLISNNAGGLISNNAGGLISNNAGGLISNNAGGLTGTVRGPAAGLISNNAGGLISNNAGGLISNNAGGLISNNAGGLISNNAGGLISNNAGGLISNNAGGLISNNAGGYRLAQAADGDEETEDLTAAVPGARVGVFNERGEMVSYSWTVTDQDGNYVFTRLKASGPLLFIRAIYEKEGRQIVLISTAPAPRKPGLVNVAVTPATTMIAKKFGEMIRLRAVNAATLRPSTASKMASALAPSMTARSVVAAAIFDGERAADTFDNILDEAPAAFVAFIEEVAAAAGVAAVVAETPAAELPAPPANSAPISVAPDETPNVDDGSAPSETGGGVAPSDSGDGGSAPADGGTAPADGGATGGGTTGGGSTGDGGAPADTSGGGATGGDTSGGGTSGGGSTEPTVVASVLKATVGSLGQASAGKRVDVEPGTGNIYAPSEGRVQTASAASLNGAVTFTSATSSTTAFAFAGGQRYELRGAQITWSGGEVTMDGIDPSWTTDLAVKGNAAYVVSKGQNCVFKVDLSSGATTLFAGNQSFYGGFAEGQGAAAAFNQPNAIAAGADALYVADTFNRRIRAISYGGDVSSLAGGRFGNKDGTGEAASFQTPTDVALGTDGNVYLVDQAGQTVRKITTNGEVSTIAGNGALGNKDGVGDAASFYFPTSISFGKVSGVDVIFVGQNDGKLRIVSGW